VLDALHEAIKKIVKSERRNMETRPKKRRENKPKRRRTLRGREKRQKIKGEKIDKTISIVLFIKSYLIQ
jgi:hypothetical protein